MATNLNKYELNFVPSYGFQSLGKQFEPFLQCRPTVLRVLNLYNPQALPFEVEFYQISLSIPARNRSIPHQTSVTSQVEVVDDRKALRDALYQGIFHRHRRTIFAVGSFLRMLKSRNSQYNTIRSSSEGEEEAR